MTESPEETAPAAAPFARELERAEELGLLSDHAIHEGLILNLNLLEEHFGRVSAAARQPDEEGA